MTSPSDFPGLRVLPPGQRRTRRVLIVTVVAVLFAMIALPRLATFVTDWLWFREIGFTPVFVTSLVWQLSLFAVGAAVAFAIFWGNVRAATGGANRSPIMFTNTATGVQIDVSRFVPRLALIVSVIVALSAGISTSAQWMTFVQAVHGVSAGTRDALFSRDVGFYLFKLPAIEAVLDGLIGLTLLTLGVVGVLFVLRGALAFLPRRVTIADPRAARQAGVLLAAVFVLIALRLWIVGAAALLSSTTGPLVGASYTDVHVQLPAVKLSAIVALIAAGLVVYGTIRGRLVRFAIIAIVLHAGVALVGRGVLPAAVQKLSVIPNELVRETPYLQRHLEATRAAWGLDSVTTRELTGDAQLTMADIQANAPTIENVRLWERDLVQQTFKQLQEIRTYYDFVSVADDRYMIDNRYRQVHLSARELNTASLPTPTFINERFTYTHGMGVTMAPVNQVTSEGLPLLFIKDLPPVSTTSLTLSRPQIYYGQLTNSYVFVGTQQQEFDYPAGDANIQTAYKGSGGVPVGSLFRRALFALQLQSLKILLSNDITGDARILYRRNIGVRARTALPFLTFDGEPFLILTDGGQLKWMLDAYTTSTRYPYAQRLASGINYMRNSVKVVIDAYDGTVDAYIADPNDPIVRTYSVIFPGIFKPLSAMPADVRRHVRYPADLFRVQALLQATYHMREPETFYRSEDLWKIPSNGASDERINPYLRHIILRLPGEKTPEFIYMTPFTPSGKDNLAAWMVARMDGAHYGEMIVYRFPKQSLVYGPKQVANRINQDTDISRELTLWDQKGSQVIRGELLVIPIEESLIYVQPIFLRAEGGTIPELKRVVIAVGNRVVMSETLESGLAQLFGGASQARAATAVSTAQVPAAVSIAGILQQAQQHYDRALAAQRAGNWAEYGREIDALGTVLKQLKEKR